MQKSSLQPDFSFGMFVSMQFINLILNIIHRLSHPASLPSHIAKDLGLDVCGRVHLNELLNLIQDEQFRPTSLKQFMEKGAAEAIFKHAAKKDIFKQTSCFSYLYKNGMVEFVLHFDNNGRLRRTLFHYYTQEDNLNFELQLDPAPFYHHKAHAFINEF